MFTGELISIAGFPINTVNSFDYFIQFDNESAKIICVQTVCLTLFGSPLWFLRAIRPISLPMIIVTKCALSSCD